MTVTQNTAYTFDTSAFLQCWARFYPRDVFPGLWERLEGMLDRGEIVCPDEVLNELGKQEDDLYNWLKTKKGVFLELDEPIQDAASEVLSDHPFIAKEFARRTHADPFVIAVAKVHGLAVVTQEDRGTTNKPRIPFVCDDLGIPCIDVIGFIREVGWRF
ncbi:MAG: DUF4411 family protein [Solirubrobacterales bacterium]|nr:DUF4411 family protein [Solirubrobacterales bacterium]